MKKNFCSTKGGIGNVSLPGAAKRICTLFIKSHCVWEGNYQLGKPTPASAQRSPLGSRIREAASASALLCWCPARGCAAGAGAACLWLPASDGLVLEGVAGGCSSPRDAATSAEEPMHTVPFAEEPAAGSSTHSSKAGWAWFLLHSSAFLFASP